MTGSGLRVVFVDYDGTLLTAQHTISATTRSALARAMRAGVEVVAASSRPLAGVHSLGGPHLGIVVALNGALVRRGDDTLTWEAPAIPTRDVDICLSLACLPGLCVNVYTASQWYTADLFDTRVVEERRRLGVDAICLTAPPPQGIHKVLVFGDPAQLDRCEDRLSSRKTSIALAWFRSEPSYLEIGRADTSKATGVEVVKRWLTPERTYAIGDGHSDIAMFRTVDVAIAVANASLPVREAASVLVAANENDGVAEALDRIRSGRL
jgi:Cof subfamily protein (haloacid dehalogenase superfamily)